MDALTLARWQFGITTVYHFFFVPLTLGLVWVGGDHRDALRASRATSVYKRMTKFWGKLFLINFAMGVVTGIVQEFQFGMNWSEYSRFVGDIFGAPLAIEALLAFFLESTFLGLWIFGWDRLPKKVAPAPSIWLVAIGLEPLGALDPDRQLVHAAAGGLRAPQRPGRDGATSARWSPTRTCSCSSRTCITGGHGTGGVLRARDQRLAPARKRRDEDDRDASAARSASAAVYALVATRGRDGRGPQPGAAHGRGSSR